MQVLVIFTIASRGLRMVGSGTVSTLIFSVPIQQTAFMRSSFVFPAFLRASFASQPAGQDLPIALLPLRLNAGHVTGLQWSGSRRFRSELSSGEGPAASGNQDLCRGAAPASVQFVPRAACKR